MNTHRDRHASLLVCLAAAIALTGGCATAPPVADKMSGQPPGTVTTYHRKSSGSLGTFDGPVVWTTSETIWQGKPVVASSSPQAGTTLLDPTTLALVATLNPAGQPSASFSPSIDYAWPLEVGKTWTSKHTVTMYPSGRTVPMTMSWKVDSWGDVTVPAGTFKAYKLTWSSDQGEVETRWVSPSTGIATVKRHVERPASHPQGAGILDAEMLSYRPPAK
jgi:hypothetical protein